MCSHASRHCAVNDGSAGTYCRRHRQLMLPRHRDTAPSPTTGGAAKMFLPRAPRECSAIRIDPRLQSGRAPSGTPYRRCDVRYLPGRGFPERNRTAHTGVELPGGVEFIRRAAGQAPCAYLLLAVSSKLPRNFQGVIQSAAGAAFQPQTKCLHVLLAGLAG